MTTCFLCCKPRPVKKLFKNCKHSSACYDCLRKCYIKEPKGIEDYPLYCFHPECRKLLQSRQIEQLCETEKEKEIYHLFSGSNRRKWLNWERWKDIPSFHGGKVFNKEMCLCPKCGNVLIKKKLFGIHRMACFCGHEFVFEEGRLLFHIQYQKAIRLREEMTRKLEMMRTKREKKLPQIEYDIDGFDDYDLYYKSRMVSSKLKFMREGKLLEMLQNVEHIEDEVLPSLPTDVEEGRCNLNFNGAAYIDKTCDSSQTSHSKVICQKIADDFEIVSVASMPGLEFKLETESLSNWEELSDISSVISI